MTQTVKIAKVVLGQVWKAVPGLRICLQRRVEQLHQPLKSGKMCMSSCT